MGTEKHDYDPMCNCKKCEDTRIKISGLTPVTEQGFAGALGFDFEVDKE